MVEADDCLAAPCDVISLNMYTVQVRDLEVTSIFLLLELPAALSEIVKVTELGFISQEMKGEFHFWMEKSGVFHGFTAWFTVRFESLEEGGGAVELNTGPNSEYVKHEKSTTQKHKL